MGSNFSLQPTDLTDQPFKTKPNAKSKNIFSSSNEEIEVLTDALDPLFPVVILEKKTNLKKIH